MQCVSWVNNHEYGQNVIILKYDGFDQTGNNLGLPLCVVRRNSCVQLEFNLTM